jgi:hypothetical protein
MGGNKKVIISDVLVKTLSDERDTYVKQHLFLPQTSKEDKPQQFSIPAREKTLDGPANGLA